MNLKAIDAIALCFNPVCPKPNNSVEEVICQSCGSRLQLQARYSAVQLLGQSGLDRTFLGSDRGQTPPVRCVIKQFCPPQSRSQPESSQLDPPNLQQLIRLGKHPQLPAILDSFEQEGCFYLIQEYSVGDNLATLLAKGGPFKPDEIWTLLINLLSVLQFIHAEGVIHGDIKPENIILRGSQFDGNHLVLVDGGTAQWQTPPSSTQSQMLSGDPEYAAPEQVNGQAVLASDLYSLGVTCLHLLTGIRPFHLYDMANSHWSWREAGALNHTAQSQDLAEILDHLIEPTLSKRLSSAEVAIAAIAKVRRQKISAPMPIAALKGECYATLSNHQGLFASINAVAIAPDGKTLASASDDQTVRIWEVETGRELAVLRGHEKFVKAVAYHPTVATRLASAGRDRNIQIWDVANIPPIHTLVGHQHQVNALAFSPDGQTLASGSADKTIKLWSIEATETPMTLNGHTLAVNAIAFSPTHSILVSASADSTLKVWSLTQFQPIQTLTLHTAAVNAIAFSSSGKVLATAGGDRVIHLWDTSSWGLIRTLPGHPWSISALSFSMDENVLFSGSWDQTVKIWDVSSGQELTVLAGHTDSVYCLAIAPDGDVIATGSRDKTIKLWKLLGSLPHHVR
jgi:WD40 repeat protein